MVEYVFQAVAGNINRTTGCTGRLSFRARSSQKVVDLLAGRGRCNLGQNSVREAGS